MAGIVQDPRAAGGKRPLSGALIHARPLDHPPGPLYGRAERRRTSYLPISPRRDISRSLGDLLGGTVSDATPSRTAPPVLPQVHRRAGRGNRHLHDPFGLLVGAEVHQRHRRQQGRRTISTAVIGYGNDRSWDPTQTASAFAMAANHHIYEGLLDTDPITREPYAALATEVPKDLTATTWSSRCARAPSGTTGKPVTVGRRGLHLRPDPRPGHAVAGQGLLRAAG